MTRVLFLPGAGGSPDFWKPVADRLPADWTTQHFGWPGLGNQPHDPAIKSLDDLVALVRARMTEPVDLVAQSMGGWIAARLAIEHPRLVRRLVLTVTSAGVDMTALGASDWRDEYRRNFPEAASWITDTRRSLSLPVDRIVAPTLLIWGDEDPISPLAVGRHLAARIAGARLEVVPGGDHDLAQTHVDVVAALIARHLGTADARQR
jgi:pimeloyl-ACP methyl ester carboxylesterase